MPADATKYLWDAREAAARIARFAQGKSLDDYLADELLRAAIERQFTILGEELGRLRQLDAATAARTPTCRAPWRCAISWSTPTQTSTTALSGA
jgi:uncharacterized protein with HEPN domain